MEFKDGEKMAIRWPGEVAEITGIPRSSLLRYQEQGDAPPLRVLGRFSYTTREAVYEWLVNGRKGRTK